MALHFISEKLPSWLGEARQDESTTWRGFEVQSENLKIRASPEKIWDVIRNDEQLGRDPLARIRPKKSSRKLNVDVTRTTEIIACRGTPQCTLEDDADKFYQERREQRRVRAWDRKQEQAERLGAGLNAKTGTTRRSASGPSTSIEQRLLDDAQRTAEETAEARRDADEETQDAEKWARHTQDIHPRHRQWTIKHRYRSERGGRLIGSATTYHVILPAGDGVCCFYRVVEGFEYEEDNVHIPFIPSVCETKTRQLAADIKILCERKAKAEQVAVGEKETLEELERIRRRELKGKDRAFE